MSPTQRTLAYLRKSGYVCQVVEHWVQHGNMHGIRRDLFGFIDILALMDGQTLAIQCTAKSGMSARYRKITGTPTRVTKKKATVDVFEPMPEPEVDEKAERQAAQIERAIREVLKAGWTVAIHGWEKGDRVPSIRYVTEADLTQ